MIYLDNAATTFPKPPEVAAAMTRHLEQEAVNPGRSGFDLSLLAGQHIHTLRKKLALYFNHPQAASDRVVFTLNATDALNMAIQGVCRPGDHVVATVVDHNSVLRPLHELAGQGISHDLAPCDQRGFVAVKDIERLLKPKTRLVVMTHASNVLGTIQPVEQVGDLCRSRGLHFLVDAAQSAGILPVDMTALGADLLAFTGHKGLLGPTGCGGLLVAEGVELRPHRWGGTGVRSAQRSHPRKYPYRLEAGTLNAVGLAGLAAGLDRVQQLDPLNHERMLADHLLAGVSQLPRVRVIGLSPGETSCRQANRLAVISLRIEGQSPEQAGMFLDADWDIAVRSGLQCAPLVHEAMGTAPDGSVRVSPGPFNTLSDIDRLLEALAVL